MKKEKVIDTLTIAFRIVTPWKKKDSYINLGGSLYIKGWNDCLKEFKKNRLKLLKNIKNDL